MASQNSQKLATHAQLTLFGLACGALYLIYLLAEMLVHLVFWIFQIT